MTRIYFVTAQMRSYTEAVGVRANVVAENEEEAKVIFLANFPRSKAVDFLKANQTNITPQGQPVFVRLDHHHIND